MRLTDAFKSHSKKLGETTLTYQQNVATVNNQMVALFQTALPTLVAPPPDYAEFTDAYVKGKAAASTWTNSVMVALLNTPTEVTDYNTEIVGLLTDAQSQANILLLNPANTTALTCLKKDLHNVSRPLAAVESTILDTLARVNTFGADTLPTIAYELLDIANRSALDSDADQGQIDALNSEIKSLQADIDQKEAELITMGVMLGVTLIVGVALLYVGAEFVALDCLGMVAAIADTTYTIAMDSIAIKDDMRQISADRASMDQLTQDVSTLSTLANSYANLAEQTTALTTNLQAILSEWQALEADVNQAIADIDDAVFDVSLPDYTATLADINEALTEWNKAYVQAVNLFIPISYTNAEIQVGMSSEEVQAAMQTSTTIPITDYYALVTA